MKCAHCDDYLTAGLLAVKRARTCPIGGLEHKHLVCDRCFGAMTNEAPAEPISKAADFDPNNPIDRLACAGARLSVAAPGFGVDEIVDAIEALSYPERFEIVNGRITRRSE